MIPQWHSNLINTMTLQSSHYDKEMFNVSMEDDLCDSIDP